MANSSTRPVQVRPTLRRSGATWPDTSGGVVRFYRSDVAVSELEWEQPITAGEHVLFPHQRWSRQGGDLGGLAGADQHCQTLAQAVGAGSDTWRAYLSTNLAG